jgi:hypothetical protein
MLRDLGLILSRLKELSFTIDEETLLLFIRLLIAVIPNAASALDSAIPFRRRHEMYVNNPDMQRMARKALQECGSSCYECSEDLDSILGNPNYLPILKRFGLDK